jgi:parallel beta-helix repeat protein
VTGDGPTPSIAQNGIQIGFDANGTVTSNVVSEVVYSLCVDPSDPEANPCDNGSSTGILVYQGSTPTTVSSNTVTTTQTGVYLDASGSTASSNLITHTLQYDGIYLPVGANSNTISNNTVTNSDESGIWVDGSSNVVTKNKINEAPIGIHAACGNTVPTAGSSKNTFYNVQQETDIAACAAALAAARGGDGIPAVHVSPVK